jgi:hydrogenase expression/formation protein HypC
MCLAIPALIKSMDGYLAEVEIGGLSRQASLQLTPEARVDDYVLLHTGYAISVIDQREAEETLKLLEEIASQPDDYRQRQLYTTMD